MSPCIARLPAVLETAKCKPTAMSLGRDWNTKAVFYVQT
jgi:hypothetical protein